MEDILELKIKDIPDEITKRSVILLLERMYQGNKEFGDWMHDTTKTVAQKQEEMIEELLDCINYANWKEK